MPYLGDPEVKMRVREPRSVEFERKVKRPSKFFPFESYRKMIRNVSRNSTYMVEVEYRYLRRRD